VTVYAYTKPADMRNGFDGLAALITNGLQRNPLDGDVFLFVSRNRVRAKALHFDGTGLTIYAKRLERGRFARVWREDPGDPITLTIGELDLFFEGSAIIGRMPLAPPALTQFSLAPDHES
jgi:transposase